MAEHDRAAIQLRIDGTSVRALAGDTLLVALLTNGRRVRDTEFGDGDARRLLPDGRLPGLLGVDEAAQRLRACSTPVRRAWRSHAPAAAL